MLANKSMTEWKIATQCWRSSLHGFASGRLKGAIDETESLAATAQAMVAPGKGILAADESSGTIEKRFKSIAVESTEENRRAYRELLFSTDGLGEFISGVILFDETIRQRTVDGTPFAEVLRCPGHHPRDQGRQGHQAAGRVRR